MSSLCWLGSDSTIQEALVELGHSRSQVKKSFSKKSLLQKPISHGATIELPARLFNQFLINPHYCDAGRPTIINKDKCVLALSKPSYIHCHPFSYLENDNLLSFVRQQGLNEFLIQEGSWDKGLLYRIDYETSGLVLLTSSFELLINYRKTNKKKFYLACVEGHLRAEGDLEHFLTTSGQKIKEDENGRQAKIRLKLLSFNKEKNLSLVEVELFEGLRHQIRCQLSLIGHPILGDTLYGASDNEYFGLHCYRYEFLDYKFSDSSAHFISLFPEISL